MFEAKRVKRGFLDKSILFLSIVVFSLFFFVGKVDAVQQKVTSFDMESGDNFGKKVAMYGDYAVVTSPNDDDIGSASGSAYVYHWNGDVWEYTQKLVPTGLQTYDYFGSSVAISDEYIAIGATGDDSISKDSGAVYVYSFDNIRKIWSRPIKLTPEDFIDDSRFNGGSVFTIYDFDGFGESVSILDNNLFVGAPTEDSAGINAGAIYRYLFGTNKWQYMQKIIANDASAGNKFGNSLSSNGEYLAVGSKFSDEKGKDSGAAYIFTGTIKKWYQQYKIVPEDGANEDYFGFDVAIYGDFVAVSSNYDDDAGNDSGSVYVFQKNGIQWLQSQKITARDGQFEDFFGTSVDMNGNRLVVGSKGVDDNGLSSGSMYKYYLVFNVWTQEEKIVAYDGQSGDLFATDVAVYDSTFLVGAYGDDDGGSNAGSAYFIYGDMFVDEFELNEDGTVTRDMYGRSVDIFGDYAAVAAQSIDYLGVVYIYRWNGSIWEPIQELRSNENIKADSFGASIDFGGNYLIIGASSDSSVTGVITGAAYIYKLENGLWVLDQKIYSDQTLNFATYFGRAVSINDDYAVVGCHLCNNADLGYGHGGSTYVFEKTENGWELMQRLLPVHGDIDQQLFFGYDVSISGNKIVVGAPHELIEEGAVYIYNLQNGVWTEHSYLTDSTNTYSGVDRFGRYVVLVDGNKLFVHANNDGSFGVRIYYYYFDGQSWNLMQEILEEGGNMVYGQTQQGGTYMDFDGDKLVFGSVTYHGNGIDKSGLVYVYRFINNQLVPFAEIINSNPQEGQYFGFSVGVSGDRIIAGTEFHNNPHGKGSAYIFNLNYHN